MQFHFVGHRKRDVQFDLITIEQRAELVGVVQRTAEQIGGLRKALQPQCDDAADESAVGALRRADEKVKSTFELPLQKGPQSIDEILLVFRCDQPVEKSQRELRFLLRDLLVRRRGRRLLFRLPGRVRRVIHSGSRQSDRLADAARTERHFRAARPQRGGDAGAAQVDRDPRSKLNPLEKTKAHTRYPCLSASACAHSSQQPKSR